MNIEKLTPAMKQYVQMKQENPDCILLFRIGDFYEVFFEDAKICASVLDLIITSKNKNAEDPIPMAWIPHHSVEKYIPRLLAQGYKVAIAEQVSDPVPWKLVERKIQSITTPGTFIQESQKEVSNLMAVCGSLWKQGEVYHIAWGDFSLGSYQTKSFSELGKLQKFLLMVRPTEIIVDTDLPNREEIISPIQQYLKCLVSVYAVPFDPELTISKVCKVSHLGSFWKALSDGRSQALSLLFAYLQHTQQQSLTNISKISFHSSEGAVLMDEVTVKNLEIFASSYEASSQYSLFGILDTTKTAAGSRLLRELLANPINVISDLNSRLSQIEKFIEDEETQKIHQFLWGFFDLSKILSLILYRKLNYVPFVKLRTTLKMALKGLEGKVLLELEKFGINEEEKSDLFALFSYLESLLKKDEELLGDGEYIADGFSPKVDELRKVAYHSDEILMEYQALLARESWIANIKLKFVMNQGYFLELTSKDSELFDQFLQKKLENLTSDIDKRDIRRRNTLKDNQRYSSPYLESIQGMIISAREKLKQEEQLLLNEAKIQLENSILVLAKLSEKLAWLDVFTSQAIFAKEKRYVRPSLHSGEEIAIVWGRHPVIEAYLPKDQPFIPNSLSIGQEKGSENWLIHIITGPNMWGKSTFLRQSAIIVLLAHCGLYVPAQEARIGLVDGIFARVGSWDIIAKNQSTFMTEMIEVANILNNASAKSFVIFDELGRGTSTYDGLALTRAILHYILQSLKSKTLIATHYHELISLEEESALIKNFSVSVYETSKEVVFMKKISAGGASKSYGVDVAKLAGIPQSILQEATLYLKSLEADSKSGGSSSLHWIVTSLFVPPVQDVRDQANFHKLKGILEEVDLDKISPLQALQILYKIKNDL